MLRRRREYLRLTPEALRDALTGLDLTITDFAHITGSDPRRAARWLTGEEDPAHVIGLVLDLLTLPDGIATARAYCDEMATEEDE
jgi:hypothetical protein